MRLFTLLLVTLQHAKKHSFWKWHWRFSRQMRRHFIIIYTLFMLLSCGDGHDSALGHEGMRVDSVSAKAVCKLANDSVSPKCEVAISIQYLAGEGAKRINDAIIGSGAIAPDYLLQTAADMTMRQIADTFVERFKQDYKEFYASMYNSDRQHPQLYNCVHKLDMKLQSQRKGIITAVTDIYLYAGGQHPMRQTIARNIRTDSCKVVTTNDLFIHGYEKALQDLIVEKLCEKFETDDLDGLKQKMVFADGDVYISQNFILGKGKTTFIYCEDEIAPHDAGEIRIEVSDKEMGKLIRKPSQEH